MSNVNICGDLRGRIYVRETGIMHWLPHPKKQCLKETKSLHTPNLIYCENNTPSMLLFICQLDSKMRFNFTNHQRHCDWDLRSPCICLGRHFTDDTWRCILVNETFCIWLKFHWSWFLWSNWQQNRIVLDNGLAPNRRQTTIWTNAVPIHWRITMCH